MEAQTRMRQRKSAHFTTIIEIHDQPPHQREDDLLKAAMSMEAALRTGRDLREEIEALRKEGQRTLSLNHADGAPDVRVKRNRYCARLGHDASRVRPRDTAGRGRRTNLLSVSSDYTAAVFGKGPVAIYAAELLRDNGADVKLVIPSTVELEDQPRVGVWARNNGIRVASTTRLDDIEDLAADIGLSVYFDQIFRERHIDLFGRLLNVHNSLLPRHRGVRPINWALLEGDIEHGVSLHEITAGVDTGPVLGQERFSIDSTTDEVADVYPRCLAAAQQLLDRTIPDIRTLPAIPQDDAKATVHTSRDDVLLGDRRYWRRGDTGLHT